MNLIINNLFLGDINGASNMTMLKRNVIILTDHLNLEYNAHLTGCSWLLTILSRSN